LIQRELARRELARRSLLEFTCLMRPGYIPGWIHQEITDLLDAFQQAVVEKRGPRLIIELPPRHGKSELISRCFPPFLLGHHPDWEVVCASYNSDLATDFGREVRSVLHEPRYRDLFPELEIRKDSNAVDYVKTTAKGSYTAVGVGGALTGRGAHVLLIDDPVRNREDADSELVSETTWKWYQSVARTRLSPGGGIIICMTRWSLNDLAGRLQDAAKERPDAEKWLVYSYPAIATRDEPRRKSGEALHPERWPLTELEKLRGALDAREWSALYQQNPVPDSGLIFSRDWIKWSAA
jgi:hypothetical protein